MRRDPWLRPSSDGLLDDGALERRKDYPRAHELASRSIALFESGANPSELRYAAREGSARGYGLHARLAVRVGREDEARRSIDKAASLRNDLHTRYSRASVHYIEGDWKQALQTLLDAYVQANGGEKDSMVGIESRFLLGQCYQQLGKWLEAKGAYEEFIAANPYEKEAFANLGLVKAKLGDSEGAVAGFSKALDIDYKFLDACRNRGTVYLGQKRYDRAIEYFSAVVAEDGSDTAALYKTSLRVLHEWRPQARRQGSPRGFTHGAEERRCKGAAARMRLAR